MIKIEFSEHAKADREERIIRIATTVGFGEVIECFPEHNKYGDTMHCLTDTGIIIVKDRQQTKVITMFPCSEAKLLAYWKIHRKSAPPTTIRKVIQNNQRKRKFLFEI